MLATPPAASLGGGVLAWPGSFGIKKPCRIEGEEGWLVSGPRREEPNLAARKADLDKLEWRDLLQHRRCVVVVDGYFDWVSPYPSMPTQRHVYAVRMVGGHPMMLAGLCDDYGADRQGAEQRFAVITVPATDTMAAPNGWMPAVLPTEDIAAWLGDDGVKRLTMRSPATCDAASPREHAHECQPNQ